MVTIRPNGRQVPLCTRTLIGGVEEAIFFSPLIAFVVYHLYLQ